LTGSWFGLWCLTTLSTIFQLYDGHDGGQGNTMRITDILKSACNNSTLHRLLGFLFQIRLLCCISDVFW